MNFAIILACFFAFSGVLSATNHDDGSNDVRNYYKKIERNLAFQNSPVCTECKAIFNELKSTLNDPKKFNKLKDVVKLGCKMYSGPQFNQCTKIVDLIGTYSHKLTAFLDNPEYSCQKMLLCSSEDEYPIGNRVLMTSLKAFLRSTTVGATTKFESEQCDECVLVINTLYAVLADGGVQEALKFVATKICTLIPKMSNQCDPFMDHYFPIAMDKIETFLSDPIQVCKMFFVCRSKMTLLEAVHYKTPLKKVFPRSHMHLRNTLNSLSRLQTKSGSDAGCEACTISLTIAIATLNQPKIMDEVAKGLTTLVCEKILPAPINASCEDFFNLYLITIIQMTINQWTPDQICTKLKACSNASSIHAFLAMNPQDQSSSACDVCQTVSNFLVTEFQQQSFQQDVLSFVKTLACAGNNSTEAQLQCDSYIDVFGPYIMMDSVPIWLSGLCSCSSMVDQYVPYFMQVICEYLSRNTLCHLLHICPAT